MLLLRRYLIVYNALCLLIWLMVGITSLYNWCSPNKIWYARVGGLVTFAMTLALLEVVHAGFGLVRSSPITTMMQVGSRLQVCYLIWRYLPEVCGHWSARMVIVAWTLSEYCRYPYYIAQSMPHEVPNMKAIRWLRYSAFLVLYPIGILGEMIAMFKAMVLFGHKNEFRHWPVPMPNRLNFELDLSWVYLWVLLAYVPGSIHMYTHMMGQRKKALQAK